MSTDGGGASRTTEPAAGSSAATDVSLKEYMSLRFNGLETLFKAEISRVDGDILSLGELQEERRKNDQQAVQVAKTTADATLSAHNGLIKQMREQAETAQRALDTLTAKYATKEDLKHMDSTIDLRLEAIESKLTLKQGEQAGVRLTQAAMVKAISSAVAILGLIIVAANYFSTHR